MPTLQDYLEALTTELDGASARFHEVEVYAAQSATALDAMRSEMSTESAKVLPLATTVKGRLDNGNQQAEAAFSHLHTELQGLETDLHQRRTTAQARIQLMLPAVLKLVSVLDKVHGEFRQEQTTTEKALTNAANRSSTAFKASREALDALEKYVREDYQKRLELHEKTTREELEKLLKKVDEVVLPTIADQLKALKTALDGVVNDLRDRGKALADEAQTRAQEVLTDARTAATTMVSTLAGHSSQSAEKLDGVTAAIEAGMTAEDGPEKQLVTGLTTAVPHAEKIRNIPVRLHEVLKKARVIP